MKSEIWCVFNANARVVTCSMSRGQALSNLGALRSELVVWSSSKGVRLSAKAKREGFTVEPVEVEA